MLETIPTLVALAEPVHRRVRLAERQPAGDAVGQELGPRGLELPADLAGDLDRGAAQDLGVELVGAAHDLGLDLEEALDELSARRSEKPSRSASFLKASRIPFSQSIRVP